MSVPYLSDVPGRDKYDRVYKIIVVGETGSGKSQLVSRFARNSFDENSRSTVVMEHTRKIVHSKRVCAQIWDMGGRDMYRATTECYIKHAHGAIVVYDVTDKRSLEHATLRLQNLKTSTQGENPVMMLIGSKSDLSEKREVSFQRGQKLAEEYGALFSEVSAGGGTNVKTAFYKLIDCVTERVTQAELRRDVQAGAGLERGAKALEFSARTCVPQICIQKPPKPKFNTCQVAQECADHARDWCCKLPFCFH
ncbi:unnamed protein product [Clavelina lepadiformis]|uniref:Uncharacterized protein n=1 Tax=Clavelina lepadiformis TaxID=159417 RepID=A0ABP0GVB2_CLALP